MVRRDKKKSRMSRVRLFLLEVLFMVILGVSSYFISLYQKMGYEELEGDLFLSGQVSQDININNDLIETGTTINPEIADFRNILLIGVDARDQSMMTNGANSDVMILVSINEKTGGIKLVSVLRDTLLRLVDGGKYYPDRLYDKANAQNCYTNISDTVRMLNLNLDLNIQEYVAVNWTAAANIVDTIGGVEMNIENEEILAYLNGYLTEVNEETGIFSPQLTQTGTQILSGTQAVAFCRIRYVGLGDAGRTNNQRQMIVNVLDRMKQLVFEKPSVVLSAANQAAGSIVTNLTLKDIGTLALKAGEYSITDHCAFPFQYKSQKEINRDLEAMKGIQDILVADDLAANVIQLHQYLYGEAADGYELPETVQRISEDIEWITEE